MSINLENLKLKLKILVSPIDNEALESILPKISVPIENLRPRYNKEMGRKLALSLDIVKRKS